MLPDREEPCSSSFATYSFTDCTNFAVMKAENLKKALSTDRHFAQAGFQCLPQK